MAIPTQKAVLVTGAAKRIGRAIALALAKEGYSIIAHYNNSEKAIWQLEKEIQKNRVPFYPVQHDLSKNPELLIGKCKESGMKLCGVVNNASVFEPCDLDGDPSLVDKIFKVNAFAPLELMRGLKTVCKDGFVINIIDANIYQHNSRFQAYRVSKRLLLDFSHEMAALYAPSIRVNAISPGAVLPSKFTNSKMQKLLNGPMGNGGKLDDIIDAMLYFVRNRNVTGQIIYADGGLHLSKKVAGRV